jgi:hypothetical protein
VTRTATYKLIRADQLFETIMTHTTVTPLAGGALVSAWDTEYSGLLHSARPDEVAAYSAMVAGGSVVATAPGSLPGAR